MKQNKLTLVVLAAGIGSRYGGLKQVDPVGPSGEMIIDYSIYDALRTGFDKVVFVISKAIEEVFHERVGQVIERQCQTAYVIQRLEDLPGGYSLPEGRVKPWGTAHATSASRSVVNSPFAVINADDYYGRGALIAVADWLRQTPEVTGSGVANFCMVGYRLENTLTEHGHVARGVCTVDEQGYLRGVRELTHIEGDGGQARYTEDGATWHALPLDAVVSMNMWGFTPGLFP
ncbi:MAG: nucleotidyltransferase, partial [Anaerolineaceae bacterium]|nr:nucleotidyltransferase [Anaerolineaceae bacterium]